MMVDSGFKDRLRAIRERAGMSQREFARKIGVSAAYICYLEAGKKEPSELFVTTVAHKFGVRQRWLTKGEEAAASSREDVIQDVWVMVDPEINMLRHFVSSVLGSRESRSGARVR